MTTHDETIPEWTLGDRLEKALHAAGMRVEDMADELEISRSTVSRWTHDKGHVRTIYLKQWALRTGVPYEWLRSGTLKRGNTRQYSETTRGSRRKVAAA